MKAHLWGFGTPTDYEDVKGGDLFSWPGQIGPNLALQLDVESGPAVLILVDGDGYDSTIPQFVRPDLLNLQVVDVIDADLAIKLEGPPFLQPASNERSNGMLVVDRHGRAAIYIPGRVSGSAAYWIDDGKRFDGQMGQCRFYSTWKLTWRDGGQDWEVAAIAPQPKR